LRILALDLGKFNTTCCFFDSKTGKHSFLNAAIERNDFNKFFKKHKNDLVVMEACGPSGWINHTHGPCRNSNSLSTGDLHASLGNVITRKGVCVYAEV
jgi:hypothetical protein